MNALGRFALSSQQKHTLVQQRSHMGFVTIPLINYSFIRQYLRKPVVFDSDEIKCDPKDNANM